MIQIQTSKFMQCSQFYWRRFDGKTYGKLQDRAKILRCILRSCMYYIWFILHELSDVVIFSGNTPQTLLLFYRAGITEY